MNEVAASHLVRPPLRGTMLRRAGMAIGADVVVRPRCYFFSDRLTLGDGSLVNIGCHIGNREAVEIGRNTWLAFEVMILTTSHEVGGHNRRAGEGTAQPVRIGDGCWIGARAVILPGVTVSDGCVIAAGAMVRDDCASDGLYGGVPARRLRDLDPN